ncbi:hypothetical protein [Glaciihabitans sp. dw_435]|uniref:hypothetical protein n=1 Tax=Glaciihabitans sp. dw_435 TaxID=2720081 RepID=UPI001BD4E010|nr:hypothetical protein [Glaciihabitans sp. dw_435]
MSGLTGPQTATMPVVPPVLAPLQLLGDAGAACVGDFCDVPVRTDRAAVIDRLDSGDI